MYKGIAGSEGIGIGNVVIIEEHEIVIENKKITDTDAEIARLQGAIEKFVNDTNAMADRMEKTVGAKDADILRGHIQMLQDPTIEEQITALIVSEKITAEKALDQVLEQTADLHRYLMSFCSREQQISGISKPESLRFCLESRTTISRQLRRAQCSWHMT
mgnify:CR=1 FL=1